MTDDFTDPRGFGGDIAGPGGPRDRNAVVIQTERAVIPDNLTVACFESTLKPGLSQPLLAMVVEGRMNKSAQRVRFLMVLNTDAAAAIVSEIVGAGGRDVDMRRDAHDLDVADGFGAQFRVALDERMERLRDV